MLEELSPRIAAAIGLLAVVPTIAYGLGRPGLFGFLSAVNVVIIFVALYLAMSPLEEPTHGSGGDTAT
ncbi:cytochrome-ba3 oxidase subunit [Natrarchaeobaculum aegyptiacum]|uniref:Cytochrome-ba3 oxidase subunit n=1 Tax=Natrarchaeobaculum aegyptiacum TaxID=745377 RepID=A0A2Z2HV13_9EURY|nr:cytochrome-ba3 oxidase subunit [Natrarchaeobaculum aegyptiacum]ARS91042.1 cytochrome-ba3 oxidase subunit [Natrarchaeobaculum aegyptiacum]